MQSPAPSSTRDRFLLAAAEQIKSHGFAGGSLSAIAARCGVTKGALAHHFPTKVAFADAIGDHFLSVLDTVRRESLIAWPNSGIRALVSFMVQVGISAVADSRTAAATVMFTDPSAPQEPVTQILDAWNTCVRTFLVIAVEQDEVELSLSVDAATDFLVTGMIGSMVYGRRTTRPADAERLRFIRLLFKAVGVADPNQAVDDVLEHSRRIGELDNLPPLGRGLGREGTGS